MVDGDKVDLEKYYGDKWQYKTAVESVDKMSTKKS